MTENSHIGFYQYVLSVHNALLSFGLFPVPCFPSFRNNSSVSNYYLAIPMPSHYRWVFPVNCFPKKPNRDYGPQLPKFLSSLFSTKMRRVTNIQAIAKEGESLCASTGDAKTQWIKLVDPIMYLSVKRCNVATPVLITTYLLNTNLIDKHLLCSQQRTYISQEPRMFLRCNNEGRTKLEKITLRHIS